MNIVPGDMIEWVYEYNNAVVDKNENLWSSTMNQFIPIGAPSLLISVTEDKFSFLSEKGLFHALRTDLWTVSMRPNTYAIRSITS